MLQEFRQLLNSPKAETSNTLQQIQNLVYSSFQKLFPQSFDFSELQQIYCEVIGENTFGLEEVPITLQKHAYLIYRILDFFFRSFSSNFISLESYNALEEQTQKAESTIRSHIKIQHEMKMYLDYLEAKIEKYQKMIEINKDPSDDFRREFNILLSKQNILQRQKINLLKKNQDLILRIQKLNAQLQSRSSTTLIVDPKQHSSRLKQRINQITQGYSDEFNHNFRQVDSHCINNEENVVIEDIKSIHNGGVDKDVNLQYLNINHDYNHDLTQKKKTTFFKS